MSFAITGCGESVVDGGIYPMPVIRYVFPTPNILGLEFETVEMQTQNGETIYAWFVPAENARATVLIAHGAVFSRSWPLPQIAMFHDLGCHVLIADYQGFAESTGLATLDTILADANTSLAYVRNCHRDGTDRIVLFGVSMGTMVTMAQAADAWPDIVGMIVEGVVQLDVLADIGYQFMGISPSPEAFTFIPTELDPQINAPRIWIPKLYLQSAQDEITPFVGAERLFDQSPEPKRLVTIAGIHGFGIYMDPSYTELVNGFLDEVAPFPAE